LEVRGKIKRNKQFKRKATNKFNKTNYQLAVEIEELKKFLFKRVVSLWKFC